MHSEEMSEVTDGGPGSTGAAKLDRGDKPTSSLTVEAGGCGVDDEAEISFGAGATASGTSTTKAGYLIGW